MVKMPPAQRPPLYLSQARTTCTPDFSAIATETGLWPKQPFVAARTRVSAGDEAPAQIKVGESINRTTPVTSSGVGAGVIVTPSSAASRKKPE